MNTAWRNWGEQVVKAINALTERLNEHTVTLPGLQADVAVLVDALMRKDAEADELRAWITELEVRIVSLETSQVRTYATTGVPMWPSTSPTFKIHTTTDGTDDGTAKF